MKKNKTFKIATIVLLTLLVLVFLLQIVTNMKYDNKKEIEEKESLISIQDDLEDNFVSEGFSIDNPNVILNPYKNSPLTALVIFETNKSVSPKITVVGKDKNSTFTHKFSKSHEHFLPVYGLYPDFENEIIIEYEGIKKIIKIKTEPLPKNIILPIDVKANKEKLNNDLYFFTPASIGYSCAYDVNGDIRWYLSNVATWDNTRLKNGHLIVSTERRINFPYYTTGLYEIDLLGKIYNEFSLPGGYHHDYFEMPNGNLLVLSNDFDNKFGTVEDYIVELDRKTGMVIDFIDLKNILNMEDAQSENWTSFDWFHNNSIWYDKKTNSITLSGRHKDAVINIDYKTKKLNWIIGDPTNWDKKFHKYFFKPIDSEEFEWQWSQHAAMITPEGYVFILDNGNNKSKIKDNYIPAEKSYTRGVMYKIDTKNMTIKQIWEYGKERGSDFYSPYISDVDYLDKNHYIVHSGGIVYKDGKVQNKPAGFVEGAKLYSDTVELINDEIVFEIKLPTNNYRVEKMPIYNNSEFKLNEAKRLGTLGKTSGKKNKLALFKKISKIDNEYNKRDFKFIKEEDRLIVNGKFKKEDKVNVLLYKNGFFKEYNLKVSRRPYTALCVDVWSDLENKNGLVVNKYINENGLNDEYSLYIELNGKIYNTNLVVDFD